jgi:hypothetical protein
MAKPDRLTRALLGAHPATVRGVVWAAPVLAMISILYVFLASAGWFRDLPTETDYYDRMAEGFRHGHLYIQQQPPPALVAKSDPFSASNLNLWLWDASLYKGHYYMYWGPLPGLMILAFKLLTGSHERISDQWPTALFTLGRLYAGAALILGLASRARMRQPAWITTLCIAVFGLANPTPFIVARPHVYEASLAGGQCFLFCGLCWAFWGIEKRTLRRSFFSLAGISWALALGCRATTFLAVPPLVLICAFFAWRDPDRSHKRSLFDLLALSVPVGMSAVGYGIYNYVRFDSATEFGVHYQVTTQPFYGRPEYVVPNVFSYLFAPAHWSCRFPFVNIIGDRPLSALIHWPPGYLIFEPVAGILLTASWCGLVVLCVWQVGAFLVARVRMSLSYSSGLSDHEVWALLCSVALVLTMVPALELWEASMRYIGDAIGGIVLATSVGVFGLLKRTHQARPRLTGFLARGLVLVLGLQTCVIGALCAVASYDDPLRKYNPALLRRIDAAVSFCRTSPG